MLGSFVEDEIRFTLAFAVTFEVTFDVLSHVLASNWAASGARVELFIFSASWGWAVIGLDAESGKFVPDVAWFAVALLIALQVAWLGLVLHVLASGGTAGGTDIENFVLSTLSSMRT